MSQEKIQQLADRERFHHAEETVGEAADRQ